MSGATNVLTVVDVRLRHFRKIVLTAFRATFLLIAAGVPSVLGVLASAINSIAGLTSSFPKKNTRSVSKRLHGAAP